MKTCRSPIGAFDRETIERRSVAIPFVVDLDKQGADETNHGGRVGEARHDVCALVVGQAECSISKFRWLSVLRSVEA